MSLKDPKDDHRPEGLHLRGFSFDREPILYIKTQGIKPGSRLKKQDKTKSSF